MKPSLARYALAVALLGSLSGAFIGLTLMRDGQPGHPAASILYWLAAVIGYAQLGPAIGFVWSRGALQKGLLPLWSRGTKRAFIAWAIFATPTALVGMATALAILIFKP